MREDKYIGILGGYGLGGFETAKALIRTGSHPVLLAGRDLEKACAAVNALESFAKGASAAASRDAAAVRVDLWDDVALTDFCRQCCLVINCAGPSRSILDRVAKAALGAGIHYVDMGGDDVLYDLLHPLEGTIRKKGLSFIVSAGMYPGLSGLFPAYMAGAGFDRVDELAVYFISEGESLTANAAYDVVASIEDGFAQGMAGYQKHGGKKAGMAPAWVDLPFLGKRFMYPSINREMELLATETGMRAIRNFISPGEAGMAQLMAIRTASPDGFDRQKAAVSLIAASQKDMAGIPPRTLFYLTVEGRSGHAPKNEEAALFFQGTSAGLMGIVAASTARLCLAKSCRPGRHFLFQGMDPASLMALLSDAGVMPVEIEAAAPVMESGAI
ncbi:MAG: saccharopine dehydrogenase NADP-binding domain-containing protein [Desulfobacter sp.]